MNITFHGAARTVTGGKHVLSLANGLTARGFTGKIYCTAATRDLTAVLSSAS